MTEYYAEKKITIARFVGNEGDVEETDYCAAVNLGDLDEMELLAWKQHVGEHERIEQPENWTLEYRSPLWSDEDLSSHAVVLIPKNTIDIADLHTRTLFYRRLKLYSDSAFKTNFPEVVDVLKYCELCANEIRDTNALKSFSIEKSERVGRQEDTAPIPVIAAKDERLTEKEACKMIGRGKTWLNRKIAEGKIQKYRDDLTNRKGVYYLKKDLEKLLKEFP